MTMEPILARAAGIVAQIHHSHGIKAALAVGHLHDGSGHEARPYLIGVARQHV